MLLEQSKARAEPGRRAPNRLGSGRISAHATPRQERRIVAETSVEHILTIRSLLRRVRKRARWELALRRAFDGGLFVLFCGVALLAVALFVGPATFWPAVSATVLLSVTVSVFALTAVESWRRLRSDTFIASLVGRAHPEVSSDLRSALELTAPSPPARVAGATSAPPTHSAALVSEFVSTVAERCAGLDPRRIIAFAKTRRAFLRLVATGTAVLLFAALQPKLIAKGVHWLTSEPTLFEGATVSAEPLVADMRVTYEFPAYTQLPDRRMENASGDIAAPPGTHVSLQMRALRSARQAKLLFGKAGEQDAIPVRIEGDTLHAEFFVASDNHYRIWLKPLLGRPVREDRARHIEATRDQAPSVEVRAPADHLELASPQPIEIGYAATDDFGLGRVDLVYKIGSGRQQRLLLNDPHGAREARGTKVWDPSEENLIPGVAISYFIEAQDLNNQPRPNRGRSRTLTLVLERTRENVDERIESQSEVLEELLGVLADRLEMSPKLEPSTTADSMRRLAGKLERAHEHQLAAVARLGRVIDDQRRSGTASEALVQRLSAVADKLTKSLRQEAARILALRRAQMQDAALPRLLARAQRQGNAQIGDVEDSALLLDDLIGRQRLEDLADLSSQLTEAHKRLQDLLERYKATQDPALKEQLLREIRELQRRAAELGRKISAVKNRNQISTEFQNMPDLTQAMKQAQKVEEALQQGDEQSLDQALADLGKELEDLQAALEGNEKRFNDDRFPQENRAMSELKQKVSDIEGSERQLSADTDALAKDLERELERVQSEDMKKALEDVEARLKQLAQQLSVPAPKNAGDRVRETQTRAFEHTKRAKRQLSAGELADTRNELQDTAEQLERAMELTSERIRRTQDRGPRVRPLKKYQKRAADALQTARELVDKLARITPSPSDLASAEQRRQADQQAARQQALLEQATKLASEIQKQSATMPGRDSALQQLNNATEQMRQAAQKLRDKDPRSALDHEQRAMDELAALRKSMQSTRMGRGSQKRETVRIPGVDDSSAPRKWRQELMEAMKEEAPPAFEEEVRRYYEELVR